MALIKRFGLILSVLALSLSAPSFSEEKIVSAVSTDFPEGLHTQIVHYLAEHLNADTDISLMPYARRLIELDSGDLNLMVGVSNTAPIGEHVIRLLPAYESLSIAIFVLAGREHEFNTMQAIQQHSIAITRYSSRQTILSSMAEENIVPARSLEQKIDMLLKHRVDSFLHVKQSTVLVLEQLGMTDNIVLADFQPPKEYEQHIAINKDSWLYAHKDKLENIIKAGIANGDFAELRKRYYAQKRSGDEAELPIVHR